MTTEIKGLMEATVTHRGKPRPGTDAVTRRRRHRQLRRAELEAQTRLRITEATMKLHGTVGPVRTTVTAIAEEAGVQRGTVYRHFPDEETYLDVWVRDLGPNHSYLLQRAVDTNVNDDCTGTSWLTLGKGLVPQAIATDETGTGRANLFRNLASIPLGTEFDIHFRVIDAATSAAVLESACYQYTVSQ
jgi:AcrR family transcriptional regulator